MSIANQVIVDATTIRVVSAGAQGPAGPAGLSAIGVSITSATPGSVLFAGAGTPGVLAQDNARLFYDATNFRLGLGTGATSPTDTLSVGGTAKITGQLTLGSSTGVLTAASGVVSTSAVLGLTLGGTGQTTANAALNALLPVQTGQAAKFLQTDGSNTSWTSVDLSGYVPTTRTISTTSPITGGGDLSANRTLAWDFAVANTWNATQTFRPAATTGVPLIANGLSGQTGDLFQAKVNGTTMSYFGAAGDLYVVHNNAFVGVYSAGAGTASFLIADNIQTRWRVGYSPDAPTALFFAAAGVEVFKLNNTTQVSLITAPSASVIGSVIKLAASQSANAFEVQNSSAVVVANITALGEIYCTRGLQVSGTAVGYGAIELTVNGAHLGNYVNFGTGYPHLAYNTTQTPDSLTLGLGSLSNCLVIHDYNGNSFDYAHPQQTNPTVFFHSASDSTTQWLSVTHNQTNGVIAVGTGVINLANNTSVTASATTGTVNPLLTLTEAAHTSLTASTERISINANLSATQQFATGALTTQRAMVVQAPTYGFVGASTIDTAVTLDITGAPIAGTNATITKSVALRINSGTYSSGARSALELRNATAITNTFLDDGSFRIYDRGASWAYAWAFYCETAALHHYSPNGRYVTFKSDAGTGYLSVGINQSAPTSLLEVVGELSTKVQVLIKGAPAQSANLTNWVNSSDTRLLSVDANGYITAPSSIVLAPGTSVNIASSLFPNTTNGYDLGGASNIWRYLYGNSIILTNSIGTSTVPLTINAIASQAANTFEMKNSSGTLKYAISAVGAIYTYYEYTDASNYSGIALESNVGGTGLNRISSKYAGTGTALSLQIMGSGLYLNGSVSANHWQINGSGVLGSYTDNTCDIGAAGANRPRNVYIGSLLHVTSGASGTVPFTIKAASAQSANTFEIQNNSGTKLVYVGPEGGLVVTGPYVTPADGNGYSVGYNSGTVYHVNRNFTSSSYLPATHRCDYFTIDPGAVESYRFAATLMTLADGVNIATNATTGTKIGTATTQKISFWNATPVVQPAHIADPAGGATVDAEARTAIAAINAMLAATGLTAAA